MDVVMSVNSSMKNSFLCTALVKECNSTDNKANWTESKKASSVKSLHTPCGVLCSIPDTFFQNSLVKIEGILPRGD